MLMWIAWCYSLSHVSSMVKISSTVDCSISCTTHLSPFPPPESSMFVSQRLSMSPKSLAPLLMIIDVHQITSLFPTITNVPQIADSPPDDYQCPKITGYSTSDCKVPLDNGIFFQRLPTSPQIADSSPNDCQCLPDHWLFSHNYKGSCRSVTLLPIITDDPQISDSSHNN